MKTPSLALACLLGVAACKPEPAAAAPPPPPKVTVANFELREIVDYDEHTGYLDAARTVEVRARVGGHLQKVHFQDGQRVKAGELLFEIDPRPFQAGIDHAKALVDALEAQRIATEKERVRQEALLGRGGASQSLVDKLTADVAALAAQAAAQRQEVERLELDLEYSRIASPIDGRIGRALLTEGNLVNAGGSTQLLATIVSIDPIYLFFTIDERALQRYQQQRREEGRPRDPKPSAPFRFALDTDEGFPRTGTLDFGDVRIDQGTGTITVRGTVSNPDGALIAGSRVRVRIDVAAPRRAAVVPDRAILADQDRRYLLLVDGQNRVVRRDVHLGRRLDDGAREVAPRDAAAPAFRADERFVVDGLLRARIGGVVDPVAAR